MARTEGTKTVAFSREEIEALGLSDANDFASALKSKLDGDGGNVLEGFDPDLQEMLTYRAQGVGRTIPEVLNAMARQASN